MSTPNQYCTTDQVAEEFKDLTFGDGSSGSSPITSDRVDRFCQEASAYIDGRIGLLYTTPVSSTTSPNSYLILQQIAALLVGRRLKPILKVQSAAPTNSQEGKAASELDPDKMLQEIVDQKTLLADAVSRDSTGGVNSFAAGNGVVHTFKRDTRQW
jgi:hypothetical protein